VRVQRSSGRAAPWVFVGPILKPASVCDQEVWLQHAAERMEVSCLEEQSEEGEESEESREGEGGGGAAGDETSLAEHALAICSNDLDVSAPKVRLSLSGLPSPTNEAIVAGPSGGESDVDGCEAIDGGWRGGSDRFEVRRVTGVGNGPRHSSRAVAIRDVPRHGHRRTTAVSRGKRKAGSAD